MENKSVRLCHVVKRDDFDGYGFNLHAEKGKPGQYIGKVDDESPAETAGLRQGDRIIEVNGVNIGNETHKQVVQRIKAIACEVRLLVVDPNNVSVTSTNEISNETDVADGNGNQTDVPIQNHNGNGDVTAINNGIDNVSSKSIASPVNNSNNSSHANTISTNTSPEKQTTQHQKQNNSGLNLTMTAAELRAKLAAKKKYDPKSDTVDLRKKYEIVQKL